jgi:transcriptional regulator with XRE-family HTH domain
MTTLAGDLIHEGRRRAGLTQAELAARAGTTQSGVARWESGRTAVSLDDVIRLLRLCDLDLDVAVVPRDTSDIAQARRLEALSGQERLERNARIVQQLRALRNGHGA